MSACSEKGMSERMTTGQIFFINIHRLPKKLRNKHPLGPLMLSCLTIFFIKKKIEKENQALDNV